MMCYYTICIYSTCSTVACAVHVVGSGARGGGCGLVVEPPLMEAEGGEISCAISVLLFHTFSLFPPHHRFSMYVHVCNTSLPSAVEELEVSFTSSPLPPCSLSSSSLSPPDAGDGGEGWTRVVCSGERGRRKTGE